MTKVNLEKIENAKIRRHFSDIEGLWYFSIVDILEIIAKSTNAQNYWKTLKNRLKKAQNELVTRCNQLKMRASDGKMYLTDVADADTMLEIIKIISEPAVTPFRLWFDHIQSATGVDKNAVKEDTEMKLMIDAYETKNDIVVEAMVGGVKMEDLLASLDYKTLTIRGKNSAPENIFDEDKLIKEISWGTFSRIIPLPALVEIDDAEATISRGLLKIKLPKIDLARTKEIKIKNI